MKIAALILFLISACPAFSQNDNDTLVEIKSQCSRIDQRRILNNFSIKEIKYTCPEERKSGYIKFFYDTTGIYFIEYNSSDGSHFSEICSYYLIENELIFIFSDKGIWAFDPENTVEDIPAKTIDYMTENSIYFYQKKAIYCNVREYTIHSVQNEETPDIDNEHTYDCIDTQDYISDFMKLINVFKSGMPEDACLHD
jgi:hypothetical protein